MKEELNIAAILKDKPAKTKLWSPIVGNCAFEGISSKNGAIVASFIDKDGEQLDWDFNEYGKTLSAPKEAEVCLFPSKEMLSWEKFAWKKGDVLVYTDGEEPYYAIFESFEDDEYTAFKSRYNYSGGNHWLQFNSQSSTNHFVKASDDEIKEFIKKVEEHYGGKLNLSTLEIDKQPEFKDGDIVAIMVRKCTHIAIFLSRQEEYIGFHAVLCQDDELLLEEPFREDDGDIELRLATDSEKQRLFDALAKENKVWNQDTKQIEDLPKKYEFKPMDWCLMRDIEERWKLCQFGFFDKKDDFDRAPYNAVGGNWYNECIPYNDSTKHLLGTTDEWKGGEG